MTLHFATYQDIHWLGTIKALRDSATQNEDLVYYNCTESTISQKYRLGPVLLVKLVVEQ